MKKQIHFRAAIAAIVIFFLSSIFKVFPFISYSAGVACGEVSAQSIRHWGTYYGGAADVEYGYSVATDAAGNVYLAGRTGSSSGIASGGFQNAYGGGLFDAFLVKFDSAGKRLWATYYGGTNTEYGMGVAADASGNVYLTGFSQSSSGIASGGFQNTLSGYSDAFLVKFDAAGKRLWATYYGGPDDESAQSVATDAAGNVYLAGNTQSFSGIASGGFQNTHGGGYEETFLVKFDAAGNRLWATYYGGPDDEQSYSVAIDAAGNVYMAGHTQSSSGIASGGFQNTIGGSMNYWTDAFLVKFDSAGNRLWATYYGGAGSDIGQSVATDASGNVYLAGVTTSTSGIAFNGFQNTYGGGADCSSLRSVWRCLPCKI